MSHISINADKVAASKSTTQVNNDAITPSTVITLAMVTVPLLYVCFRPSFLSVFGCLLLASAYSFLAYTTRPFLSDYGEQRRKLYYQYVNNDYSAFADHTEGYRLNSRNELLFHQSWKPLGSTGKPSVVIIFLHGYVDHSSWFFATHVLPHYIEAGYTVHGMDYRGHGRSDGLHGLVDDYRQIVNDSIEEIRLVKQQYGNGTKYFIHCESMGGANTATILADHPDIVDGAVLCAPMCKIADQMKPAEPVIQFLKAIEPYIPTLAIVPSADMNPYVFKREYMQKLAKTHPLRFARKPRLATALTFLNWTDHVVSIMSQITTPILIVHGSADKVTDPNSSKLFHSSISSKDKTLEIIDGGYHSLLAGESGEDATQIMQTILQWVQKRSGSRTSTS